MCLRNDLRSFQTCCDLEGNRWWVPNGYFKFVGRLEDVLVTNGGSNCICLFLWGLRDLIVRKASLVVKVSGTDAENREDGTQRFTQLNHINDDKSQF